MTNATADHDKVKTDVLSKTKDELRKLASNFKYRCTSVSTSHSVSSCNALVIKMFNALINPTFIQHLKLIINRAHSGDNKLKGNEIIQCFNIITALHFYQVATSSFLIMIMGIH